jgi:hypothetical protein
MATINDDYITEKEEEADDQVAQLQPISATDQATTTFSGDTSVPKEPPPEIQQGRFEGQGGAGTTSAVDLSNKDNEDQMWVEYENWKSIGRAENPRMSLLTTGSIWSKDPLLTEEREKAKYAWYLKYYGMAPEDYDNLRRDKAAQNTHLIGPYGFQNTVRNMFDLSAGATSDWVMDAVGTFPGLGVADNFYDKATKSKYEGMNNIRSMLSIVVPSILSGGFVAGQLKTKLPTEMAKWQKRLIGMGAFSVQEAAVIGLNDLGEEHNALRALADFFPGVFGEKGAVPIPNWAKTLDSDSPMVRKYKNMFDTAGLSIIATTLGAYIKIKGGKGTMEWMEPLDEAASRYKTAAVVKEADIDKLLKIQDIDNQLALGSDNISSKVQAALIDERTRLMGELDKIDDLDAALDALDNSATAETNIAAINKINNTPNLNEFDPDVTPILSESGNARQSIPPGNVARNMGDVAANKTGISKGDNAPVLSEAMRAKGLMVGSTSRDAIMGVAEQARDAGRFNALVDGFRFSSDQMNETAWAIYKDIVNPEMSLNDVKKLFAENKDVKNLLLGKFKVEYINEEQARAAAFAMRDLTDRFLGRKIAESSARVMDTLGREAATLAETVQELQPFVNDNRAMDLIIDKMQFLMDEYGLNKYISGWSLRNKNWFDAIPDDKPIQEVIDTLSAEFKSAENAIHAKNLKFTEELKRLSTENPLAMRPLIDAFAHTNGDVDSLAKLYKWAAEQVTPTGMLKSPDPKQLNLFTRSAWGVIYNNVLSGISAFRAGIGNTSQLILKPITGVLGHGIWGAADGFEGLKRTMYYNGAVFETNRRALHDAYQMMKKANADPEFMTKAYRKDFVFKEDASWDIMEDMRGVWEAEGNAGRVAQYDMAKTMNDMSKMSALRYGMTGMVFTDVFSQVHLAHYLSRMRAYDDVFTEFGFADWKKIAKAEKIHYDSMFDKDGLITDKALKAIQGEVALNLDDGLANWINQGTTAYPVSKFMLMFPRTGSNYVRNAISWTPLATIPGMNKYSKTLWARTDDDIARALAEHGIDMATTPNAKELFKNLRAEYTGRLAFSSILTKTMWDYAMAGNIRGNGHYNKSRRNKERDQLGYRPKTINIGGKWISYKGIVGVDPILSILGDMAYYARDLDQPFMEDAMAKIMWTLSATFLSETPLTSIEPLVAAANGDLTGWSRLVANAARAMIPQSGALGVGSNAITSTQKDIEASIPKYVQNKIPIASSFLPEQIDIWTGTPLNDIQNPFLRILNSLSPIKISGTEEPWRKWLLTTGWDGLGRLKKDSTGSYEYSETEREFIYKEIGKMQLYKKLIPLMNDPAYKKQIGLLRSHRVKGGDLVGDKLIKLKTEKLPLFDAINNIIKEAQLIAETKLIESREDIQDTILKQQQADKQMSLGDVQGASNTQKEAEQTRKLLQMSK